MIEALLVRHRVDANVRADNRNTALHLSATEGNTDVVEALIRAGADANARDGIGATALHGAALRGHSDVVTVLVRAGADVKVRTSGGKIAMDFAVDAGHIKITKIFREIGGEVPWRRRVEPDADTALKLLRTLQGDTALRIIEGLVGLDVRRRSPRASDALEQAAAVVLETVCISIDMALPPEMVAPMRDVRDRLDAAKDVLDDLWDRLNAAGSKGDVVDVAPSASDSLERLNQLATLHEAIAGADLVIEPMVAVPGSIERRLVELKKACVDALGELEAAVRNL